MKALISRKVGMTQVYDDEGELVPVTVLAAGPCVVSDVKTPDKDGYSAVQLGFEAAKDPNRAQIGQAEQHGLKTVPKMRREIRVDEAEYDIGDTLDVSLFSIGDQVAVTGTSKGKGFAGTVKRHNFTQGPRSHGSKNVRRPGSIGSMYPQKIFKGKEMAGRMGGETTTVQNLKVAFINEDENLIGIKGAVPGPKQAVVLIQGADNE